MSAARNSAPVKGYKYLHFYLKTYLLALDDLFFAKTYVAGTQKNCLNEMVLLSIQNTRLNQGMVK